MLHGSISSLTSFFASEYTQESIAGDDHSHENETSTESETTQEQTPAAVDNAVAGTSNSGYFNAEDESVGQHPTDSGTEFLLPWVPRNVKYSRARKALFSPTNV